MITVEIVLHSAITGERTVLADMVIANDGTGSATRGNYRVRACRGGRRGYRAEVKGFPRKSRSALELLRRSLNALAEQDRCP